MLGVSIPWLLWIVQWCILLNVGFGSWTNSLDQSTNFRTSTLTLINLLLLPIVISCGPYLCTCLNVQCILVDIVCHVFWVQLKQGTYLFVSIKKMPIARSLPSWLLFLFSSILLYVNSWTVVNYVKCWTMLLTDALTMWYFYHQSWWIIKSIQ